jgi:hypothetical protein
MKSMLFVLAVLSTTVALADEVDPFNFEKDHFVSTRSRAEVKADVKEARAKGELPRFGELGVQPVETPSVKTRAQVAAETREAARLGLLGRYGEQEPKIATPEQERQIRLAGERAVHQTSAAK